jgi:8-oxo-dGTP pyrophosphatase MutT (NUDIX family)
MEAIALMREPSNKIQTEIQTSAGGVVFRRHAKKIEIALISVGTKPRWQLPKGLVNEGESTEAAALREVREETGLTADMVTLIDKIDYWFYANHRGQRLRYHKFVYFYLMRFVSGEVQDHDHEVHEARWVELSQALAMLAFKNEQVVVVRAREMIETGSDLTA